MIARAGSLSWLHHRPPRTRSVTPLFVRLHRSRVPPWSAVTQIYQDVHIQSTCVLNRDEQCSIAPLQLDLGPEFDDAVGRDAEVDRRIGGIARHEGKE
jgi:hypothetical protein